MRSAWISTSEGRFTAWFSDRGLARLEFPDTNSAKASTPCLEATGPVDGICLQLTNAALANILAGNPPGELPPLDLSVGSDFQQQVWLALLAIPHGRTSTYAAIAAQIGRPRSIRAVGNACGANPIPVIVPCHRVLRTGGGLGGFSAGLSWKTRLLGLEHSSLILTA
jgi:O-6-methylguanine DNA methyltransferase